MKPTFISIINDCRDPNAVARQITRVQALFPESNPTFVPVVSTLEAGFTLMDILDASLEAPGLVLVNIAPRDRTSAVNGSPFAYFWLGKSLVLTTIEGYTLSLLKKLDLIRAVNVLPPTEVVQEELKQGDLLKEEAERVSTTQFRSFEFLPRVAR